MIILQHRTLVPLVLGSHEVLISNLVYIAAVTTAAAYSMLNHVIHYLGFALSPPLGRPWLNYLYCLPVRRHSDPYGTI